MLCDLQTFFHLVILKNYILVETLIQPLLLHWLTRLFKAVGCVCLLDLLPLTIFFVRIGIDPLSCYMCVAAGILIRARYQVSSHTCACKGQGRMWGLFLSCFPLGPNEKGSHWTCCFGQVGCPANSPDLSATAFSARVLSTHKALYMMARGPNSGPHTCRTGAVTNRLQLCSLSFFTNNFYLDEFSYDNIKIFLVNEEVLITNDFFILYYLLVTLSLER